MERRIDRFHEKQNIQVVDEFIAGPVIIRQQSCSMTRYVWETRSSNVYIGIVKVSPLDFYFYFLFFFSRTRRK